MPCHAMHCHVFCAIHHNRSCHSWLQRASALPTVQACASPWKTVCIDQCASLCMAHCAHCASMCKPVHCTLCTLCKQPRNKYLGSIQLAHHQLNCGVPSSPKLCQTKQTSWKPMLPPRIQLLPYFMSNIHHPRSCPSLRATETHNLHDPDKRPVLL